MSYKYSGATAANERLFRKAIWKEFEKINGGVLVDLGAGSGVESVRLGKLMGAKRVICIDHDGKCLKTAKKNGAEIVKADLNGKIGLKKNTASVVLLNQVIEHIAKTDTLLGEVWRILKPGGKAIICTPNLASWHNIGALFLGWQPFSSQVSDEAFLGNPKHPLYEQVIKEEQAHLRIFTQRSLRDLCEWHGLMVVKSVGVGFYPFGGVMAKFLAKIDGKHAAYVLLVAEKIKEPE